MNPIVWNAVFDANTGQTVNSTLSAAQQSLIGVLLAQQPVPVTNLLYFSQPAADAEILVTKDVSTDNSTDFISRISFSRYEYDFSPTSDNLRELNVRVSDDLKPVIVVSQQDINSRQDGLGDFNRVFPTSAKVTLEAPPTYGRFVFDQWLVNNQPQTTTNSAVSVFLSADSKVEARYRLAVGPALTLVTAQQGQISFRFPPEPGGTTHWSRASTWPARPGRPWKRAPATGRRSNSRDRSARHPLSSGCGATSSHEKEIQTAATPPSAKRTNLLLPSKTRLFVPTSRSIGCHRH